MTDSLSAGAIADAGYTVPEAAVASVAAGNDMVLFGSTLTPEETALLDPSRVEGTRTAIIAALVSAVGDGTLAEVRLDEAVMHVLAAKGTDPCAVEVQR
jgi:beta-glucosidase-like glycosyl hydrolase